MWLAKSGRRCPDSKRTHCQAVVNSRAARKLRIARGLKPVDTPSFEDKKRRRKASAQVRSFLDRRRAGTARIVLPGELVITPKQAAEESRAARMPGVFSGFGQGAASPAPESTWKQRAGRVVSKIPLVGRLVRPKDYAHHKKV